MADEYDDEAPRTFEPISNLTLGGLGRGMLNRARTQGEGIARQVAQNYQDLARVGRDAVTPIFPRASTGQAPWERGPEQMTESPFSGNSRDTGVRVGAQVFDPANLIPGGGALGAGAKLGARGVAQAAASRALREAAPIAAPVAERELPRLAWNKQAGFITPKYAGALAGGGLGLYGLSRALRGEKKTEDDPAARTTANAFRQRQDAMDAVDEELARQQGRGTIRSGLNRMERQLDEQGK